MTNRHKDGWTDRLVYHFKVPRSPSCPGCVRFLFREQTGHFGILKQQIDGRDVSVAGNCFLMLFLPPSGMYHKISRLFRECSISMRWNWRWPTFQMWFMCVNVWWTTWELNRSYKRNQLICHVLSFVIRFVYTSTALRSNLIVVCGIDVTIDKMLTSQINMCFCYPMQY